MNGHKFIGRKFTCLLSLAFSFNPTCLVAKAKWRGESAGKDRCLGHNVQVPTHAR